MSDRSEPAFVSAMAFSKPWRPYQARVLDALPQYVKDGNFHLVSAPGSGKTVTGLEVLRQIGQPTLVLVPTLAIREQWIDRLLTDFLDGEDEPSWISRDLRNPAELTVSTYQSLSSEFRKEDGMEAVLAAIEECGISTIVVDEAHHLRAVWWQCLSTLKESLAAPMVVALTATPPIDVPASEWARYASFCGEVDMEVGVPELVAEGNLCPHQDYVIFSIPSTTDIDKLGKFHRGVNELVKDLEINVELAENLGVDSKASWFSTIEVQEERGKHQRFFLALAIFLYRTGGYLPEVIESVFGISGEEIPEHLGVDWCEELLQGILFSFREQIEACPTVPEALPKRLKALETQLREIGAIEKGKVVLRGNAENEKLLRDSATKLDSIVDIIDHEIDMQGVTMRAVVLTDYLRKEAFPTPGELDPPLVKLGVVPIFEKLRRIQIPNLSLGALTGTLVIIPSALESDFIEIGKTKDMDIDQLKFEPLAHDSDYVVIDVADRDRQCLVASVTELFETGKLNCLIGTASLLGEGWDAPALNTLVLASVIGSFVMSNQMRGRAIRTDPDVATKTSNIWHVATLSPQVENADFYQPGRDFEKLERRFEAFHGVGFELDKAGNAVVENGWARLGINASKTTPKSMDHHNRTMFRHAEQRSKIAFLWEKAISEIGESRFLRAVQELSTPRRLAASRFTARFGKTERGVRHHLAGWMERRRLHKIVIAIAESLQEEQIIDSYKGRSDINVTVHPKRFTITAPSWEPPDQAALITALDEYFDVFQSPRYIIHQKDRYFSVPKALNKKSIAMQFSKRLRKAIGRHDLIYAHSDEGKSALLIARRKRLLNQFEFKTDKHITWRPV